jgi:phosphatidylglycerophosphate synthase
MSGRRRGFGRATALTGLRLLLAPVLHAAVVAGRPVLAVFVFALAVATDFADGWAARRFGEATPLGGLADHAVDAIFVAAGTAALARLGALPAPLPPLILAAFLQYALDSGRPGRDALRASFVGRWNGIAYYVIVAVPIVRDALGIGWPGAGLLAALGWLLVASTLVSMADRLIARLRTARGSPA